MFPPLVLAAQTQANAMEGNVDAIKIQMRQEQRAWLDLNMEIPASIQEDRTVDGMVEVTTVGRTPAIQIAVNARMELIANGTKPDLTMDGHTHAVDVRGFLFPNKSQRVLVGMYDENAKPNELVRVPLTHEQVVALKAGKAYLIIHVLAFYHDVFGTEHWIRACAYKPFTHGNFTIGDCVAYNEMDHNQ